MSPLPKRWPEPTLMLMAAPAQEPWRRTMVSAPEKSLTPPRRTSSTRSCSGWRLRVYVMMPMGNGTPTCVMGPMGPRTMHATATSYVVVGVNCATRVLPVPERALGAIWKHNRSKETGHQHPQCLIYDATTSLGSSPPLASGSSASPPSTTALHCIPLPSTQALPRHPIPLPLDPLQCCQGRARRCPVSWAATVGLNETAVIGFQDAPQEQAMLCSVRMH